MKEVTKKKKKEEKERKQKKGVSELGKLEPAGS